MIKRFIQYYWPHSRLLGLDMAMSVLGALLAILLPSLNKAKEVARKVICKSNLHQWGLIWQTYTQ